PGVLVAAGHARADDPDRRLLEGVRDDRLADRLARGAGRDRRGHPQDPPVHNHDRADRCPRRRAGGARRGRAGRRPDARRVRSRARHSGACTGDPSDMTFHERSLDDLPLAAYSTGVVPDEPEDLAPGAEPSSAEPAPGETTSTSPEPGSPAAPAAATSPDAAP